VDDDIPYLLLTPGPLTTSRTVRQAMQQDFCTWDADYNSIVTNIRERLVGLVSSSGEFTSVLMQGSGTFSVEATIGSLIPADGKLLVIQNGAYGERMAQIADRLKIQQSVLRYAETEPPDVESVRVALAADRAITHVAVVHSETTTGMLNPVAPLGRLSHEFQMTFIVDAMSSFGGIPMTMDELRADFLISSANKCIQGTPGFGFVVGRRSILERCRGRARSLSLDLYDQWHEMETKHGKWRYTSPTHVVRAFKQALDELACEGGVPARHARYVANQRLLVKNMSDIGFRTLLPRHLQSPFITAFHYPQSARFDFLRFYEALKRRRFVIYPGKVSGADTFRIGTIGHVFPEDIQLLTDAIAEVVGELGLDRSEL
jgi:2-aminoethylphosphonate-pyruvate transaminase